MKYLIASNSKYSSTTCPPLIDSLTECGIKRSDIIVVRGQCERDCRYILRGIKHIDVTYGAWEYTPLIEVVRGNIDAEEVFLLHDTCKVGSKFREIVEGFDKGFDAVGVYLGQCNIGMFKRSYLCNSGLIVEDMKNCSKHHAIIMERVLWQRAPSRAEYGGAPVVVGEGDVYGNGIARLTEYYEGLDLYKYKANWNGHQPSYVEAL